MASFLILTTDLPYFPGKNGHDFFNVRFLAQHHRVGVVAPAYESYPDQGVANLVEAVDATYLWPKPADPVPLLIQDKREGRLSAHLLKLSPSIRKRILLRLIGLQDDPDDAFLRLAVLSNCAPQLLAALEDSHWQGLVIVQTSNRHWLNFLPRFGAKCIYFHDVRADYYQRSIPPLPASELRKVLRQEQQACREADAVGFVSVADQAIAERLFDLPESTEVAPIPVDHSYFTPPPPNWVKPPQKTILFTGHLGHPPNVDAVEYLAGEIWPQILETLPDTKLIVAGMQPAERVRRALAATANASLHENVPDIRPFFWNASVYVVPMRFGGGVRQKIFEAWSMGVPVVMTPMAAEGSEAQHGRDAWLESEPQSFAKRVVSLLETPAPAKVLDAAAEATRSHHSIAVAGSRFVSLCEKSIQSRRNRPFRLLYDLRWMEIGRSGGTEQMTHELIHAISNIDHTNQYTAYSPRSSFHEWELDPKFKLQPEYSDEVTRNTEIARSCLTNRLADSVGEQPVMTPELRTLSKYRELDFDLVHSTCGYVHPDLAHFPQIVTACDLQHIAYPQFFGPDEWKERDLLYRNSVNRAVHIISISEFTRQDLHRNYGVPLDKITTIWIIPSRHVWTPLDKLNRERVLSNMGLTGPFLFFPAHSWPHKNHARLLEAFALILPHIPPSLRLIFTGRPFEEDHPALPWMNRPELRGRVTHLGYRTPLEMKALFHGCELLVFPSLFEGFGMPVAEAMISGKPVACSSTTSLPEIAGDAAELFDPENIHEIGASLLQCINNPVRRKELVAAATRRRSLFSSRTSAIKTLSLYRQVYDTVYG